MRDVFYTFSWRLNVALNSMRSYLDYSVAGAIEKFVPISCYDFFSFGQLPNLIFIVSS